ncbi:putative armadillo/beta-catenin-like repeat protein [Toxoplasma gondii RUB]|uniref:Putative armadillo/beta-catenin-like repeat protein n=1 Tax=Toxoplasma gondii RUB TaxID=935652 RepID=A0A086LXH8_TOXGO|nr:putative armadillo/beta-catenin-like repeat protein [Toxoplasma gondii RUB]
MSGFFGISTSAPPSQSLFSSSSVLSPTDEEKVKLSIPSLLPSSSLSSVRGSSLFPPSAPSSSSTSCAFSSPSSGLALSSSPSSSVSHAQFPRSPGDKRSPFSVPSSSAASALSDSRQTTARARVKPTARPTSPVPFSSLFWVTDDAASPILERIDSFFEARDAAEQDRDPSRRPDNTRAASASGFPTSALSHADIRDRVSRNILKHRGRDLERRSGSAQGASRSLLPVQLSCASCGPDASRGDGIPAPSGFSFTIVRQWSSSVPARAPSSVVAIRVSPQPAEESSGTRDACGGSEPRSESAVACSYTALVSVLGYDVETQSPFSFICCNTSGSVLALLSDSACCVATLTPPLGLKEQAGGDRCGAGTAEISRPALRWLRDEDWEEEEEELEGEAVVQVRGLLLLDELQRNLELPGADDSTQGPSPRRTMVACCFHPFSETALVLLSHEEVAVPHTDGVQSCEARGEAGEDKRAILRLFDVAVSTEQPETEISVPFFPDGISGDTSSELYPAPQLARGQTGGEEQRPRVLPVNFALGCSSEALELWPALSVFLLFPVSLEGATDAPGCLCFCPFLPRRVPTLPAPLALALREATTQARLLERRCGASGPADQRDDEDGGRDEAGDTCVLEPHTRAWLIQREAERVLCEELSAAASSPVSAGLESRERQSSDAVSKEQNARPARRVPVPQWVALRNGENKGEEKRDEKKELRGLVEERRGGSEEIEDEGEGRLCAVQLFATNPLTMLLTATVTGALSVWASAEEIAPRMQVACSGEQSEEDQGLKQEGRSSGHSGTQQAAETAKPLQFFLLQKTYFCRPRTNSKDPRSSASSPSSSLSSSSLVCTEGLSESFVGSVCGRLSLLALPPSLTASAVPAAFVFDACRVSLVECHYLSASSAGSASSPGEDARSSRYRSRPCLSLHAVLAGRKAEGSWRGDGGEAGEAVERPLLCSLSLRRRSRGSELAPVEASSHLALVGSCLSDSSLSVFSLDVSPLLFGWGDGAADVASAPEPTGCGGTVSFALPKRSGAKHQLEEAAHMLRQHHTHVEQVREKIRFAASAAKKASASGRTTDMRQATAAAAEFASSLVSTLQFADENLLQSLRHSERRLRSSTTANLARCTETLETQVKEMWATHECQVLRQKEDERRLEKVKKNMAILESLCVEAGRLLRERDESLRLRELEEAWTKLERDISRLPAALLERSRLSGSQCGREDEADVTRSSEEGLVYGGAGCRAAAKGERVEKLRGVFPDEGESEVEDEEQKVATRLLRVVEAGGKQLSMLHERQATLESLMQKVSL